MGISDEDYAKALKIQQAYAVQQMKKEADKQKEEAKMAGLLSTIGNIIGSNTPQVPPHHQPLQQAGTGTVHISHGSTTTTFTGGGAYIGNPTTGTFTPTGLKAITEENLQHDAMKAPLSALVDMWTVRWQGEWVNESEFDEDDFWRLALVRLLGANKLEKHNLANHYRHVYRIIE